MALIDHLRCSDKRRIRRVFGCVANDELAALDQGLSCSWPRRRSVVELSTFEQIEPWAAQMLPFDAVLARG